MTPMMQQYQEIKAKHQDAILFFRLGDFYEMFFDDALEASRLLQITLTARNKRGDDRMPMCGVPYHAANNYIAKLTRLGRKVAICEQLSDPKEPGIVRRDVIRIITPGTTLDDNILEQKCNNYILALVQENGHFGLAYSDVSTGEFLTTQLDSQKDLQIELEKIKPSEILVTPEFQAQDVFQALMKIESHSFFFPYEFTHPHEDFLKNFFKVFSLEHFGLSTMPLAAKSSAMLLHYLENTQKTDLTHIQHLRVYTTDEYMPLDEATLKNLELLNTMREHKKEGSLLWVLDQTITAMGGRKLRFLLTHPLLKTEPIQKRLDAVEELFENARVLDDFREIFKQILDFERLLARLSLGQGNARDIVGLKMSLKAVPYLQSILFGLNSALLCEMVEGMDPLPDLVELIERAIVHEPPLAIKEGGMIKEGFHPELDKLRTISREGKTYIQSLQQKEIERTGINSLKIRFNQVFGYYIEISKTNLHAVPQDYIRKQTLVNGERFITPELKEYEEKVLGAEEKIVELEYQIFSELRKSIVKEISRIQKLAQEIALLDVLCSFAKVALENRYCKPSINDTNRISLDQGRHPVVEKMSFSAQFVANDILLDPEKNQFLLLTGPNMGGKSTYLRQVALIVLMAQIGSFVPTAKAEIGIVDRIFTRVGASDNLIRGQSTFMVEMQETAYILNNATDKSLVILDEIGRGTSTYDGMSIAWAIVEFLHDQIKAKTLFATHYHELIALTQKLERARNYSVSVKEDEKDGVVFLYKIIPGGIDKSYGIEVATLAGLPLEVIKKAKKNLTDLEEGVIEQGIRDELTLTREHSSMDPAQQLPLDSTSERNQQSLVMHHEVIAHQKKLNHVLREFEKMDLNNLTPLQALQKLSELKDEL